MVTDSQTHHSLVQMHKLLLKQRNESASKYILTPPQNSYSLALHNKRVMSLFPHTRLPTSISTTRSWTTNIAELIKYHRSLCMLYKKQKLFKPYVRPDI